jgi:hypothetical protein
MTLLRAIVAALALSSTALAAPPGPALKTRNVFLVMVDGLRRQEVFTGADPAYMTDAVGKVKEPEPLLERWARPDAHERRSTLMPFLWGTIAAQGQVFGNHDRNSRVSISNGIGVSYPGYAETLCGVADPIIKDNRQIMNPNPTVLEVLHARPEFKGRVAAFGAWSTFRFIFRSPDCGFPVDDGAGPFSAGTSTPEIDTVNRLRQDIPYRWGTSAFDGLVVGLAIPWVRANSPRVVFLCLGETDEWAHEYDYAAYLDAAHRSDAFIRRLWESLQALDQYRGTTTLIVCPDHGRGDLAQSERAWGDHGPKYPGSEHTWLAVMGPDTPALGERENTDPITQDRIAATIAALLGVNLLDSQPRAGPPITDVLPRP